MAFTSRKGRQGVQKDTGYDIDNSLRFNDNDSAYLSRTPSTAGNQALWTASMWIKRGNLGNHYFFGAQTTGSEIGSFQFTSADKLLVNNKVGSTTGVVLNTDMVFRDTSAWYHIIVVYKGDESTASNRAKIYVNGALVSTTVTESLTTGNGFLNSANPHGVGRVGSYTSLFLDGYLAEVNFVDGQALTPDNFGETGDYGEWKPIEYTGTYGTNGFYLDFKTSGSLGNDANGSNNWTPNNLSATDQMLDSPTNNFCTLTPLNPNQNGLSVVLSEGNLAAYGATNYYGSTTYDATMRVPSGGKWYAEGMYSVFAGSNYIGFLSGDGGSTYYISTGTIFANSISVTTTAPTFGVGDIIAFAVDNDAGTVEIFKNGSSVYSGSANTENSMFRNGINGYSYTARKWHANFGQDSSFAGNKTAQGNQDSNSIGDFYYTPPTGYLALCTQNLPDPAVIPSEHFNTVTYTGNGYPTSNTQSVIGVGFQPDWTWIKVRDNPNNHRLFDVVRGVTKDLISNSTGAEEDVSRLTSFDSDGFTTSNNSEVNREGNNIVAWNWKANGAGVSNTNGTITSTVSANADAGFSIVKYTGDSGTGSTVGHGLNSALEFYMIKNRDSGFSWTGYHEALGSGYYIQLNSTGAQTATSDWNNTAPTTSVFTVSGAEGRINLSGTNYIAYCFHSVEGYSKVGSFEGNGSADGTFIHCGFTPAYVMVKEIDSQYTAGGSVNTSWGIWDSGRMPNNPAGNPLFANLSSDESTRGNGIGANTGGSDGNNLGGYLFIDMVSNGFKCRTSTGEINGASTHIFLAFAEHPFKYTNAR